MDKIGNLFCFMESCRSGNELKVHTLIAENNYLVNEQDSSGYTGLMHAMFKNHDNIVKLILEVPCCDIRKENFRGLTALHYGIFNPLGLRLILRHPMCTKDLVLKKNNDGFSIVDFTLSKYGNDQIAETLLEYLSGKRDTDPICEMQMIEKLAEMRFSDN